MEIWSLVTNAKGGTTSSALNYNNAPKKRKNGLVKSVQKIKFVICLKNF